MLIASSWYVWAQVALVALLRVAESPLTPQLSHNVDGGGYGTGPVFGNNRRLLVFFVHVSEILAVVVDGNGRTAFKMLYTHVTTNCDHNLKT